MEDSTTASAKRPGTPPGSTSTEKRAKTEHYVLERDVGITEHVLPDWTGFTAIIKHRFADFLVNEIDTAGRVVRLTSYSAVDDPKPAATEEQQAVAALAVPEDAEEAFEEGVRLLAEILGTEDAERVRVHLAPKHTETENGTEAEAKADAGLLLERDLDKDQRRAVYRVTNNFFGTRVHVDTVCGHLRFALSGGKNNKTSTANSRKLQQKRQRGWNAQWDHIGDHCRFVLEKENSDTMDVVQQLAACLRVNVRAFGTAGTKDKRAVTVQLCSAHRVAHERLQHMARRVRGIRVGNFSYGAGLRLGDLSGNRFVIVLRFVRGAEQGAVERVLQSIGSRGFVNYFGLQRFGSNSVASHEVGRAVLLGDWALAVDLVLRPRAGEPQGINLARGCWARGDVQGALDAMPSRGALAERAVLRRLLSGDPGSASNWAAGFSAIPRNLRLMYVHAFQSFVWNRAASHRVRQYGCEHPVPGDLALRRVGPLGDHGEPADADADGDADEQPDVPRRLPQVELVTPENLHTFSIYDVVLPLPGSSVTYPSHDTLQVYEQTLTAAGLPLSRFGTQGAREYRLQGAYRHVLVRPRGFSHTWLRFDDAAEPLAVCDS
ncbi:multisubstrate pseudouridine synthase 7, partial [Coemansia sp. RSA 2607]